MKSRFFLLRQRSAVNRTSDMNENFADAEVELICSIPFTDETKSITSLYNFSLRPTRPLQNIQSSVAAPKPSNSSKKMKVHFKASFKPVLCNTIHKVVYLWRYGSEDKIFKRMRLIEKKEVEEI